MRIPGRKTLQQMTRWIKSCVTGGVLILGYHRVADDPHDVYSQCVSPNHFQQHLDVLQRSAQVISIEALAACLDEGKLPRRTVALTFDDGYAGLVRTAVPLLESRRIPATVFVVAGVLGEEFWWDELHRRLPGVPQGVMASIFHSADLPVPDTLEAQDWDQKGYSKASRLTTIYHFIRALSLEDRQSFFKVFRQATGGQVSANTTVRTMTADEVHDLSRSDLVSIGSHSVTHAELPPLEPDARWFEIQHSKELLEGLIGRPVTAFSYPFGARDAPSENMVREAGYRMACTSTNGATWMGSPLFALPRFWIPDWDGDRFARWLHRWLRG